MDTDMDTDMAEATVWLSWDSCDKCRDRLEDWLDRYEWVHVDDEREQYRIPLIPKKGNKVRIAEVKDRKEERKLIRELLPESFRVFFFVFDYAKYSCIDALEDSLDGALPKCKCGRKFYAVCHVKIDKLFDDKLLSIT